jgi:hypothetical protein
MQKRLNVSHRIHVNKKMGIGTIEPVNKSCERFGELMGQNEISQLTAVLRSKRVLHGVFVSSSGKANKQSFDLNRPL